VTRKGGCMQELKDIEKQILYLLYRRDVEDDFGLKINISSLNLQESDSSLKTMEAAYHLNKLKELRYIEIGYHPKAFLTGGDDDNKYRNNVILIMWENIKLSNKGRLFVVEDRKTLFDKFKLIITNFFKDMGNELRSKVISHIVTFILGIIVATIYILYFSK